MTQARVQTSSLNSLSKLFLKIDKDQDGRITRKELQEGLKEIYGAQSAEFANLVGIFDQMNANGDGGVYYGEFIIAA